jgi:hypothetical protein
MNAPNIRRVHEERYGPACCVILCACRSPR